MTEAPVGTRDGSSRLATYETEPQNSAQPTSLIEATPTYRASGLVPGSRPLIRAARERPFAEDFPRARRSSNSAPELFAVRDPHPPLAAAAPGGVSLSQPQRSHLDRYPARASSPCHRSDTCSASTSHRSASSTCRGHHPRKPFLGTVVVCSIERAGTGAYASLSSGALTE